jgi:hypothetical protein
MAETLRFIIDGQDRGQPLNWKEFGATIQRQKDSNAIFTTFDNDLIFTGGVYDYIKSEQENCNFCSKLECVVINNCNDSQNVLVSGFILLTDCEFDLDLCQVKTKFVDDGFQTRLNNNKSVEIWSNAPTTKNGETIIEPYLSVPLQRARMFNPPDGVYYSPDRYAYGWSVYNAFKILVAWMSDNAMDFESDYFNTGAGKIYMVSSGQAIRNSDGTPFKYSFEQLYSSLNKKIELGFGFQINGTRPVLRIEPLSFFENNPAIVNLLDVPGVRQSFDQQSIYAAVELGSDEFLEEWQGDNNNEILSFPQVRFRGFKSEQFGLCGECNIDNVLQLTTRKVIFDTNIIENILTYQDQKWDEFPIIVQWDDYVGSADSIASVDASAVDIFGIGSFQYNSLFTNDNQAANNINGFPCSLEDYYNGYDPDDTVFLATNNGSVPLPVSDHEMYLSNRGILYSSSATPDPTNNNAFGAGRFLLFEVEVNDPGGNYLPSETYISPAPGIYTLTADIWRRIPVNAPFNFAGAIISWQIIFTRMLSDGTVLKRFPGPSYIGNGNLDENQSFTKTMFLNEGDHVSVDVFASSNLSVFGDGAYFSAFSRVLLSEVQSFSGSGVPIQGGVLEPTDGNSFQAVINKFRYPLSREEITELINDTTKGLAFTRSTDSTTLQTNNISRINIPSIHKGLAEFELKYSCNDGISLD